jgi:GT2 family glycosyltransferase
VIKTSVVILNWNTRHQLETFLPYLVQHTQSPDTEIVVADNASTDDSVDFVKNNFPQVKLIVLDKNYGFAEGYNRALKQIDAKYYVLINSDIEVTPNWINPIITNLENDDLAAACMPKLLSYQQRDTFEYAGAAGGYIDFLGYPFCKGRIFDSLEKDEGQFEGISEIFWATGACIALKAEIFNKLGGFDPYLFAHMEEIDLCWRMKSIGYKIYCNTNSKVFHVGGGTLNKTNPFKTYLNFRNNLILLHKNLPFFRKAYILPIRFIMNFLSIIKYLMARNSPEAIAVLNAYWGYLGYIFSKKQKVFSKAYPNQIYKNSIVVDFFVRKKEKFSDLNFNNL